MATDVKTRHLYESVIIFTVIEIFELSSNPIGFECMDYFTYLCVKMQVSEEMLHGTSLFENAMIDGSPKQILDA